MSEKHGEKKLVVVGHGMVAQRFLEKLTSDNNNPFDAIEVLSAEPVSAYNRVLLSAVLSGEQTPEALQLQKAAWFERRAIRVKHADPATALDTQTQTVTTASGYQTHYHTLIIATGSRAASLQLPGEHLPGVVNFRDIRDTEKLIHFSERYRRAVVIGGGFLGLEAAEGLRQRGMRVRVIHRSEHLLNRQLDPVAAELLQSSLEQRGLQLLTGRSPVAIEGAERVEAITLDNGERLDTDLVVLAAGITPNTGLARSAGLHCDRAIVVGPDLQTSHRGIYALGECCQVAQQTFGLVEPGYQQAGTLARILCGEAARFEPSEVATRLKISGIAIYSCGDIRPQADTESVIWQDLETDSYCHLLMRDNRLAGAVLFGQTHDGPWYFEQLQRQCDLSKHRQQMAFGAAYCAA